MSTVVIRLGFHHNIVNDHNHRLFSHLHMTITVDWDRNDKNNNTRTHKSSSSSSLLCDFRLINFFSDGPNTSSDGPLFI